MNFSLLEYLKSTYLKVIPSSLVLVAVLMYFAKFHPPTGYFTLIGSAMIGAVIYLFVAYWTLLDQPERNQANDNVRKLVKKLVGKVLPQAAN